MNELGIKGLWASDREVAVQAEMRAMAEERLAKKGI